MHDQQELPNERPSGACVTCPPPRGHAWVRADDRHATCSGCYDKLRERLTEITERYLLLDPRPGHGAQLGGRRAPGFASRPPADLHVVSMRDPRSSQDAHIWTGKDGRVHAESTRPVLSVHGTLSTLAWAVAEHRGVDGPGDRDDVYALVRFIDRHIDYVTRHTELATDADWVTRRLTSGLRPVTGEVRRRVGTCPNMIEAPTLDGDPVESVPCTDIWTGKRSALYAAQLGDPIVCHSCGFRMEPDAQLEKADALNAEWLRASIEGRDGAQSLNQAS